MSERGLDYLKGGSKRRLDWVGSLAIGMALFPVAGSAAIVSGLDTSSNPFYRQNRVGRNGQEFNILKFRTLSESCVNGDTQTYGTHDPRASRVGLALRKLCIDELPQITNVLRGDMSLVGLRPLIASDMELLHDLEPKMFSDWLDVYLETKPGVTGPGQIHRKIHANSDDNQWINAMRLDLDYSENATLSGDIRIIASSPIQLLRANLG